MPAIKNFKNCSRIGLLLLSSSLLLSLPAHAEDYDELEDRIEVLEEKLEQGSAAALVSDLQALQAEVRELRGEVERLQYEAEQQRLRQRDMNLDIEKRLSALEKGTSAASTGQPQASTPNAPAAAGNNPPTASNIGAGNPPITEDVDTSNAGLAPTQQPAQSQQATPAAAPTIALNEQDEYLKAFELLKQGSYDESIKAFQAFLKNFPEGDYTDNARYWLAETYYVKRDYQPSLNNFEQLLAQHPNSSKLPGALLKIGYIQYELGNNAEARIALERVRNEFSGSNVAELATQRLERMDREGR
ncbi:MAG: tol-pal system protein YbgF [Salinisphaeraceae bacterium]|nr:tol-pal system protein YbgF [Salinisphaeraceae bacterium]